MPTLPIENLLHKPDDNPQLTTALGALADAIAEAVNFGTHVLKWCADAATDEPEDVPLLMLLRHDLACVGNQHKWDRLGPEKIIIMKSCVGAP